MATKGSNCRGIFRREHSLDLRYPWLSFRNEGTAYLPPDYYRSLLKPYVFNNRSDLEIFGHFLERNTRGEAVRALEIGPGTGRATEVMLGVQRTTHLTLLDQSWRMTDFLKRRLKPRLASKFVVSDAIDYLASSDDSYDFIYSLWSLSHSIHQTLHRSGPHEGRSKVYSALRSMFYRSLSPGGYFFLIHFDATSEEQTIALRQRSKLLSWLRPGEHSPSKVIIDDVLRELGREGVVEFETKHLIGDPIIYSSLDEALEVFMNFHMEGHFNDSSDVDSIVTEISEDLSRWRERDGTIRIRPGCFVYTCRKLASTEVMDSHFDCARTSVAR